MNIPRFSNPHFTGQDVAITSRSELYGQPLDSDGVDPSQFNALHALLREQLELPSSEQPPRKKPKHRHVAEGKHAAEELNAAIPFRLLSSAKAPREIHLTPKVREVAQVREPAYEDDNAEATVRRERALAVAVDFDWVMAESRIPTYRRTPDSVVTVRTQLPLEAGMALLERSRPYKSLPAHLASHLLASRSSPREPRVKAPWPTVSFEVDNEPVTPGSRRRNRRTATEQPHPSFWRPLVSDGKRALGYAMGYEGSRVVDTKEDRRRLPYARDRMKKITIGR